MDNNDGWALVVCKTCNMPVRVKFENGKIVQVLAVCGHVEKPES